MIALLKHVHMGTVALSFVLFFLRGIWSLRASYILQRRWVKVVPHVVDTVLLVSAIALAWAMSISPLNAPWLLAKIVALIVYVFLGFVAIDFARRYYVRLLFWLAAQAVFLYIVAVAFTKEVLPWAAL
jgi:uncharacterized membrane protein SirB2